MMEKKSLTRPPSTNHRSLLMLTITGTMAVLTNLTITNFRAIDMLYAVLVSCYSIQVICLTTSFKRTLMIVITIAIRNEKTLILSSLVDCYALILSEVEVVNSESYYLLTLSRA